MTRTILRIKRRRTEEPLPFIRLEGLNSSQQSALPSKKRGRLTEDTPLAESDFTGSQQHQDPSQSTSVLWKRLEPQESEGAQSFRVVDALLEQPSGPGEEIDRQNTKRRKLTVLETTSCDVDLFASTNGSKAIPKRKAPLKVLDPLTRIVDDSLQEVHAGSRTIADHFRLVTTDPRFINQKDEKKLLQWCHSSGGNILHSCALWNDVEMAGTILQIDDTLSGILCEAIDGDSRTPYEVAQLSGHESVCEVLEAFGGDTTNFVYDVFCLDDGAGTEDLEASQQAEDFGPGATVELTSGVAYWAPDGQLMLEADEKLNDALDDEDQGDIDSNCEDYNANDYPEEEDIWGYSDVDPYSYPSQYTGGKPSIGDNVGDANIDRGYMQRMTADQYSGEEEEYNQYAGGLYDEYD